MRKEADGWHFKENWFLKYIWGSNCWSILGKETHLPRNLCSLFWGSVAGMFFSVPAFCVVSVVTLVSLVILAIVGGFFGFYLNFYGDILFFPYKHAGRTEIPVAAWEVCAIGFCVYILVADFIFWKTLAISSAIFLFGQLVNSITLVIIVAVTVIAGVLFFLFKATACKVMRECVKAAKQKVCPLIVIDP